MIFLWFLVIFGALNVIWQGDAFILGPWGTILAAWRRPGPRPREQQKGHLGVRSRIFCDFESISGVHFGSYTLEHYLCFCFMRVSSFFFNGCLLWIWSWWSLKSKHSVWESVQKTTFRRCRDSVGSRFSFWVLSVDLGPISMSLGFGKHV